MAKKIDHDSIAEHARITQAILSNAFLNEFDRSHSLFQEPFGDKGGFRVYKALCVGSFSWQQHMVNDYAKMVAFPIFFDLLDLHVDKRFGCANSYFDVKAKIIKNNIDPSLISDAFLLELYTFCTRLRNKMLHHNIAYEDGGLSYGAGKIRVSDFRIINEIIYQYVAYGFEGRPWYNQNAMLFFLDYLIGGGGEISDKINSLKDFTRLSTSPERYKCSLHNKYKHAPGDYILDFIFVHAGALYDPKNSECQFRVTHPDPEEKIAMGGRYYFIEMEGKCYLFPSELVIKEREVKFSDLSPWIYEPKK
ncbi:MULTISPECIES: hypothetical protein [Pseudomonas]|nr:MULTISPECIES: hypothetical protein [Pseudomonas]MBH3469062.1 hypothetical protein [Pseudomonas putida]MCE0778710.1 hypothetical protein [Pseudomonas sp. NMI542_15]